MSEKLRSKHWKRGLTIVTILALLVLAYVVRKQLGDTIDNLGKVNAWALLLLIPLQIVNYHAQTKLYQSMFLIVQEKLRYRSLYRLALELNFVNNIFPSGGVSGFSYFSLRLKSGAGVSGAKATIIQLMKYVMMFVSFQVLLGLGLIMLSFSGRVNGVVILVASSLVTLLAISTMLLGFVVGSKRRIQWFLTRLTKVANRIIHIVRPKYPETINISKAQTVFTELHENYKILQRQPKNLVRPLFYSLLANTVEVLSIYVVYIAFGSWVNPGAVIIGYAIANVAGLVSVLPGGVGIYEALMTAVLAASGVPAGVSLPVTVMYRVLSMAIQLPPGFILYNRAVHLKPVGQEGAGY
jgi:uncharacterized protein (TIRG00374 family)